MQDIDVDLWDKVFAINVRGSFLTVKHAVPHMIARKYGKIVNIGSGTVYKGLPGMLHYTASKGAIATFTRTLSRELGEHGICVNTLAPGLVMSETLVATGTHDDGAEGARGRQPRLQARPAPARSARRADIPVFGRQRFRHRPDHRGGWRLGKYLIFAHCEKIGDPGLPGGATGRISISGKPEWQICRSAPVNRADMRLLSAQRRKEIRKEEAMATATAVKLSDKKAKVYEGSKDPKRAAFTTRFRSATWRRSGRC